MPSIPAGAKRCRDGAVREIELAQNRVRRRIKWYVPAADVPAMVAHLAGDVVTVAGAAVVVRAPHPDDPDCYCTSIEEEPSGNSLSSTQYSFSFITATYETPLYDTSGDRPYITFGFGTDASDASTNGPVFSVGGIPLNQAITVRIPGFRIFVTAHNRQIVNEAAIFGATQAPVNSATFATRYGTYNAGYVFFEGLESQETVVLGGQPSYDVTLSFRVRGVPWNYSMTPTAGLTTATIFGAVSPAPYATSDLNLLFA